MRLSVLFLTLFVYCIPRTALSQSLCGPLPEGFFSAGLTYLRIPGAVEADTFRFSYRVSTDCGTKATVNSLHIIDPQNPANQTELDWILDSSKNITGVSDPCLLLEAPPCHTTYYYHADARLNYNRNGYFASTVNCCRPYHTINLNFDQNNPSYSTVISLPYPCTGCAPCVGQVDNGIASWVRVPPYTTQNSSPVITSSDTILYVSSGRPFAYHQRAVDPDGDSLAFHFSEPRTFLVFESNRQNIIKTTPQFPGVDFKQGYSVSQPAGQGVSLDRRSGLLQGSIADTGLFVISESVLEFRNQVLLDSISQDLLIRVFNGATLPKPKAITDSLINSCASLQVKFSNNSVPLYPSLNWNNTTFQWNFGDGDVSADIYPVHTYPDSGTYQARLIIFPGLYCADTSYSRVILYPTLQAGFDHDDSCLNSLVHFINTSSFSSGRILGSSWQIYQGNTLLDSSGQFNTSYSFKKAPQTYLVKLRVAADKGCSAVDSAFINIWPGPFRLLSHDTILARGAILQLQANDGNFNQGGQFLWTPSEGLSAADLPDPLLSAVTDNTYHLYMRNSYGCSLSDSIRVSYYTGPDIYVPTAFTPDGDGHNDQLRPVPVGMREFRYFRVFNRFGQLVFETAASRQGWDGRFQGHAAPAGTYVWEAAGVTAAGRPAFRKGTTILIRN